MLSALCNHNNMANNPPCECDSPLVPGREAITVGVVYQNFDRVWAQVLTNFGRSIFSLLLKHAFCL
jgi:hypothetical protein